MSNPPKGSLQKPKFNCGNGWVQALTPVNFSPSGQLFKAWLQFSYPLTDAHMAAMEHICSANKAIQGKGQKIRPSRLEYIIDVGESTNIRVSEYVNARLAQERANKVHMSMCQDVCIHFAANRDGTLRPEELKALEAAKSAEAAHKANEELEAAQLATTTDAPPAAQVTIVHSYLNNPFGF